MPETVLAAIPTRPAKEFVRSLAQAWEDGAAVLPFDPANPASVTRSVFEALRPGQVRTGADRNDLERGLPIESDVALVVLTSGSVSSPPSAMKAAELTHSALAASAAASLERLGASKEDRWLCCLPFAHIASLTGLTRARTLTSAPLVHESFTPEDFFNVEAEYVSLVPTMLQALLEQGISLSKFKAVLVGGGPVRSDLLERAREAGVKVVVTYWMTETCGGCVYDGRPLSGVEVTADDQSRIRISGPMLMKGYRLRSELTQSVLRDGWFLTDDFGHVAGDGSVQIEGRADFLINTGGQKVNPSDVEAKLSEHPSITGAMVLGLQDSKWGEAVGAVVESSEKLTAAEIADFVRESLPAFMAPRRVAVVQSLPRTSIGKPDRSAGRRILESQT